MDPIDPIPTTVVRSRTAPPVERLEPVSRERDRPSRERRQPPRREPPQPDATAEKGDDGRLHVDVRA
jgi:hypothetical protein